MCESAYTDDPVKAGEALQRGFCPCRLPMTTDDTDPSEGQERTGIENYEVVEVEVSDEILDEARERLDETDQEGLGLDEFLLDHYEFELVY